MASRTVLAYAYSPSQAKTVETANNEIRREVALYNWTIHHESSLASEGTRLLELPVDCDSSGNIEVHDIETKATEGWEVESQALLSIYGEKVPAGYGSAVKVLVYNNDEAMGKGEGYAWVSHDARKITGNANNVTSRTPMVGIANLDEGCKCSWGAPLHELMHSMGATQGVENFGIPPAPFSTSGSHCYDVNDLMCTHVGGYPFITPCTQKENEEEDRRWRIDCDNDTYFNPVAKETEPESWLAEHWNIGEEENPFLVEAAEATTESAAKITGESAEARAAVNPRGSATTYFFEYGTSTSYGSTAPIEPKSAGSGSSPVTVGETLTKLTPNTTYHYRVVAKDREATVYGEDQSFKTGSVTVPSVTTEAASSITANSATLNATVNPDGGETTYYFKYGKEPATYVSTSKQTLPPGSSAVKVSALLAELGSATEYQFRIVAENSAGKAEGSDLKFKTLQATALCKSNESPCVAANRYANGTSVSASLKSATSLILKGSSGETINSCTGSSLEGKVTGAGGPGEATSADVSTASFTGCTNTLTAEGLSWHSTIAFTEGGASTETFSNLSLKTIVAGVSCTYGASVPFSLSGGAEAQLAVSEASLPKTSGSFACPSTVKLSATYLLKSPAPLYITPYPLGATVLCKTASEVCAEANRYASATKVTASLKSATTLTLKESAGKTVDSCTGSSLEGKVSGAGGETEVPTVDVSSASFTGCSSGAITSEGLSWHSEIRPTSSTNGTETFSNLALSAVLSGVTCKYGGQVAFGLTGASQAELAANEASLAKTSGSFLCPSTVKLTATYLITAPAPLYVSRPK